MSIQEPVRKSRFSGEAVLWVFTVAAVFGSCGTSFFAPHDPSGNDPLVSGGRQVNALGELEAASSTVALLKRNGSPFGQGNTEWDVLCTGSVITPHHILTAAHCFESVGAERLAVQFPFADGTGDTIIAAGTVKIHPDYRSDLPTRPEIRLKPHDIAVVTLSEPIPEGYRPARVATAESSLSSVTPGTFLLAGYGTSRTRQFVDSGLLRATDINLRRVNAERATIETVGDQTDGLPKGGCAGDSGAPLLSAGDVIFGVLSTGGEIDGVCVGTNTFTDVRDYRTWIHFETASAGQQVGFVDSGLLGHESAVVDLREALPALDRGSATFPISIRRHEGMRGSAYAPPGLLPPGAFCRIELRMMFQNSKSSSRGFKTSIWRSPGFELSGKSGVTFYIPSPATRPRSFSAGVTMECDGKPVTVASNSLVSGSL